MIRRLRHSFVGITMLSVILVLTLLMGTINVVNYISKDRSNAQLLQMLADNNGSMPSETSPPNAQPSGNDSTPPEKPAGSDTKPQNWSAETPYETRYFSVTLNENDETVSVDTGKIAAISSSDAISLVQSLSASGKTSGYSGNYKFCTATNSSGQTIYIFLDCTRDLSSVRQFLRYSLLISLGGIVAIFFVAVLLSRRAVRPIAESYEKQKHFITDASHEIKTPLAVIASCTDVLEMEQGESKWSQGIRSQVDRLTELTQGLVSLARMDEHTGLLVSEEVNFSELLEETVNPFVLMAQKKNQHFQLHCQPDIKIQGDKRMLQQLCSILADNAVKYTPDGGNIAFTLQQKGRKISFVAENDAEGLSVGNQKQLFDRFYRGDQSRSSQCPGYGIGLSLAQSIVSAHGGKIEATSRDGTSLTITVQF